MSSWRGLSTAPIVGGAPGGLPDAEARLGVADDGLAVLLGHGVDDRDAVGHILDRARDRDLALGQPDAAELDGQALERIRAAAGLGLGPRDLRHRPQAVQDLARQPDLLGEVVVDVDRVEVAGRARVADRDVAVGRDLELGELLAGLHHAPRTMLVQMPTHTVSASWFVDTDWNVKNPSGPRRLMSLTETSVVTSSPAITSGPQSNSWPPCTRWAKSMPSSGSNSAGPSATPQ